MAKDDILVWIICFFCFWCLCHGDAAIIKVLSMLGGIHFLWIFEVKYKYCCPPPPNLSPFVLFNHCSRHYAHVCAAEKPKTRSLVFKGELRWKKPMTDVLYVKWTFHHQKFKMIHCWALKQLSFWVQLILCLHKFAF